MNLSSSYTIHVGCLLGVGEGFVWDLTQTRSRGPNEPLPLTPKNTPNMFVSVVKLLDNSMYNLKMARIARPKHAVVPDVVDTLLYS